MAEAVSNIIVHALTKAKAAVSKNMRKDVQATERIHKEALQASERNKRARRPSHIFVRGMITFVNFRI